METQLHPNILLNNKLYYRIGDAALCIEVSDRTIRREINRKKIRCLHHPSKGYLFLPEWLDEWLESRTTTPKKSLR